MPGVKQVRLGGAAPVTATGGLVDEHPSGPVAVTDASGHPIPVLDARALIQVG